ncbi:MAG: hypothetical protein JW723_13890 [Bacteroidales bacterium]|nr:hypothetical protein [Bacteroidales bacterium]
MFKNILVVIIILVSLSFFELKLISNEFISKIQFAILPLMLIYYFFLIVYDNGQRIVSRFRIEIILIWIAVILSMFGAYYFHHQNFGITAIAQRAMYFYIFYFLLLKIKCKPELLVKTIFFISLLLIIIYLFQTIIYPHEILYSKMGYDRGTLRIFIPGLGYLVIAYFYTLNRFLNNLHYKYLIFCFAALVIFILSGTRQLLGSIFLITMINLIVSKKIKSRFAIYFISGLAIISVFYIFKDIIIELIDVTFSKGKSFKHDVRIQAVVFFMTKLFPNKLSYIIGNGVSGGHSSFDLMLEYYAEVFGYYQSDIGIFGGYSKFGILFVIANIIILARISFMRLPENYRFLRYANFINVLTILTGDVMSVLHGIVLISVMLYLIDVSKYQPKLHPE